MTTLDQPAPLSLPALEAGALLNAVNEAIFVSDLDFRLAYWNRAAETLFGWRAEEVVGQRSDELLHIVAHNPQAPGLWQAVQASDQWRGELRLRSRAGAVLTVEASVRALRAAGGQPTGYVTAVRDVSERRQPEALLLQRLRLLDLAHGFIRDAHDRIIFWNTGATHLYGYTAEEACGQIAHELLHTEWPIPKTRLDAHLADRGYWHGEVRHRRRDGVQIIVASHQEAQRDERGDLIAVIEVNNNITDLKQAERRLQNLREIDRAILQLREPDDIATTALQHVVRLAPAQTATIALIDWERREASLFATAAVEGQPPIPVGQRFPLIEAWVARLRELKPILIEDRETLPEQPTGLEAPLQMFRALLIVPLHVGRKTIGALSLTSPTAFAFSERHIEMLQEAANSIAIALHNAELLKRVQSTTAELRGLTAQAVLAQEAQRRELARELHDRLGQNLTVLSLMLSRLRYRLSPGNSEAHERLDDAMALVEATVEHTRDLTADLRPPMLDDGGLLAALRWYATQIERRSGLRLEVGGKDARLPPEVAIALFRIAQEAVTNVLRHARARQLSLRVEAAGGGPWLTISDDGVGFEPQAVAATGWGLIHMRERAHAIGGRLRVESTPGAGTHIVVEPDSL